jgi:hypothetical protein
MHRRAHTMGVMTPMSLGRSFHCRSNTLQATPYYRRTTSQACTQAQELISELSACSHPTMHACTRRGHRRLNALPVRAARARLLDCCYTKHLQHPGAAHQCRLYFKESSYSKGPTVQNSPGRHTNSALEHTGSTLAGGKPGLLGREVQTCQGRGPQPRDTRPTLVATLQPNQHTYPLARQWPSRQLQAAPTRQLVSAEKAPAL